MRKLSEIFSNIVDNHHDQHLFMAGEKEVLESIRALTEELSGPDYHASYVFIKETFDTGIMISNGKAPYAIIPFKVVRDHASNKLVAQFVVDPQLKSGGLARFDLTDNDQKARAVEMLGIETLGQIQRSKHTVSVLRHFDADY